MMSEQEETVWGSYGIAKDLLSEKLQGVRFWFFIERTNMPLEEWKVVIASLDHDEMYSLDEMIGKEKEFCDKVALKFLFS
jgi:hypothetical protein